LAGGLPHAQSQHETMQSMVTGATNQSVKQLAGLSILIVDNHIKNRTLLMDFLAQQGCRVYLASDGRDGYAKARAILPDVILMEIAMPVRLPPA
jgi:PleD family two-component response regulator